jgi:ribokinase
MSARVCVVGALHRDLVVRAPRFPVPGETLLGEDFALFVGGKGANQAVAAARLGARVALVGAVGDDEWGRAIRSALTCEGIDLTHVQSLARTHTGVGVITVVEGGENTIVVAPGADRAVTPDDVERASGVIADADVLLVQGELFPETTLRAMEIAKNSNTAVICNPAPAQPLPAGFLAQVDLLVANRGEAAELLGEGGAEIAPPGLARRLGALGPERVVLTLGAEGALHFNGTELEHVDAFPVDAIDATAAGDAFAAALAVARAEGARLKDAVRFACAAGALATTIAGALPSLPDRDAVEGLVSKRKGSRVS